MKKAALIAFIAFWAALGFLLVRSVLAPSRVEPGSTSSDAHLVRPIATAELARHARGSDCWIGVRGQVYDVTAYLPSHPAGEQIILPWCGRDATRAFQDLGAGRTHSPRAWRLLERYRVGVMAGG